MALIQVILAIALVVIFFIIGFAIYNMEFIKSIQRSTGVVKISTPVFKGVKDFSRTADEVYNTTETTNGSYRNISPSYNQGAGVEYTYNFWLYVDHDKEFTAAACSDSTELAGDAGFKASTMSTSTNQDNGAPVILFLKGHKELGNYKNICSIDKTDIVIKNPLVKLEQCGKNLTVEFNTIQSVDAISENSPNVCSLTNPNWSSANAHKLTLNGFNKEEFDKKWSMITIIVQDTYPQDPYPIRNKVRCRIYVNSMLELDRYVDGKLNQINATDKSASVLKLNDGHLHVAPQITKTISGTAYKTYKPSTEKGLMMADLTYFNYILEAGDIDSLFNTGFNKASSPVPGDDTLDTGLYNIATKPTKKQLSS